MLVQYLYPCRSIKVLTLEIPDMSLLPQEIRYNRKFKYTRLDVGIMIDVTDFGKKKKRKRKPPSQKKLKCWKQIQMKYIHGTWTQYQRYDYVDDLISYPCYIRGSSTIFLSSVTRGG